MPGPEAALDTIERAFTWAFLSPMYAYKFARNQYNSEERVEKRKKKIALTPPKAERRKRALTIPSEGKPALGKPQKTLSQSQSWLFRFPREIRDLIWQEVILDATAHHDSGIYIHWKLDPEPADYHHSHRPDFDKPGRIRGIGHEQNTVHLTPLLRTCRAIYSEAIPLVYSLPEFYFGHPHLFLVFIALVPPERVNAIRNVGMMLDDNDVFSLRYDELPATIKPLYQLPDFHCESGVDKARKTSTMMAVTRVLSTMHALKKLAVYVETWGDGSPLDDDGYLGWRWPEFFQQLNQTTRYGGEWGTYGAEPIERPEDWMARKGFSVTIDIVDDDFVIGENGAGRRRWGTAENAYVGVAPGRRRYGKRDDEEGEWRFEVYGNSRSDERVRSGGR